MGSSKWLIELQTGCIAPSPVRPFPIRCSHLYYEPWHILTLACNDRVDPAAAAAIYGTTFPAIENAHLKEPPASSTTGQGGEQQKWPVMIFSHGAGCSRLMYVSTPSFCFLFDFLLMTNE